jgi:hypothetical protein
MRRNAFAKGIAFGIIIVFIGMCLGPAVQSSSSGTAVLKEPSPIKERTSCGSRGQFYAYDLFTYYICTFDLDAVIHNVAYAGIYFLSGGDINESGTWYAVSYSGGLYSINKDTGACTYIAYTIPLDTLTYDTHTGTWYTSDSLNNFYMIDIASGAMTYIGNFGIANVMTNLMCDTNGTLYGFSTYSFDSALYSIDKATGASTLIGDTGTYVTGANFDRNNGTLYVATYDIGAATSNLAVCDPGTGAVVVINQFSPMDEISMLIIPYSLVHYDHDVGVKEIKAPFSGTAGIITPEITVKNYGLNNEYFPTEVTISRKVYSDYMLQDFEGSFPPAGWTVQTIYGGSWHRNDYWSTPRPNMAGTGYCADADMQMEQNAPMLTLLTTPPINLSTAPDAVLDVDSYEYVYYNDILLIDISIDGGNTWNNLYNVTSTYEYGQYHHLNLNLSAYAGNPDVRIRFGYFAPYTTDWYWEIDNVKIRSYVWSLEYDQQVNTSLGTMQTTNLTFPAWTPADLGVAENVNVEYKCDAQTLLTGDQQPQNDMKEKTFTLHYGYFHDVALTSITSPNSGPAQTMPVSIVLENHGQNAENASVKVQIEKIANTTVIYHEDFSGGVLPPDWGTTDPSNWYVTYSNYAGGVAPELLFNWYPEIVTTGSMCHTGPIDTTGYSALQLSFKQDVNDFLSDYTLEVWASQDGGSTWSNVYTQAGGPYGPTTTTVSLAGGSPNLEVAFVFIGDSYNINYWYIDDVKIESFQMSPEYNQSTIVSINPGQTMNVSLPDWTPEDRPILTTMNYLINASVSLNISDENPLDNTHMKFITLSYDHDVGVTKITEPTNPYGPYSIFWQGYYFPDESWAFEISGKSLHDLCYDDFSGLSEPITEIMWRGLSLGYDNGWYQTNPNMTFDITFYEDNGGQPGTIIKTYSNLVPYYYFWGEHYNGSPMYIWDVALPEEMEISSGWISIQSQIPADNGNLMWATGPQGSFNAYQRQGDVLVPLGKNMAFDLETKYGQGPTAWRPGTYQVAAIVKNFGTYQESNIPVEAKITHTSNNTVIYDETTTIPGLTPFETLPVAFSNFTIPYVDGWQGTYKLEIWTALPGDDHPDNDKKTFTFKVDFEIPPPPITNHTFSGTMGDNGWYVSNVTITFTYQDPGPPMPFDDGPHGVNHTYYKLQNEDNWTEYRAPVVVSVSGMFNLSYYSVDKMNVSEPVKGPFPFKIDKNTPVFINFTVTPENLLKTKWLLNATVSDQTSGVARVEFYVDGGFVSTVTSPIGGSWIFEYQGDGKTAQAIVYDNAGNSAMSNQINTLALFPDNQPTQYPNGMLSIQQRLLRQQ